MNIGTLPARHARDRPSHLALVTESERLTLAAFEQIPDDRYVFWALKHVVRAPSSAGRSEQI